MIPPRLVVAPLVLVLAGSLTAGCDKLPWSKSHDAPSGAKETSTTAQRTVTLSRPQVPPDELLAMVNGVPISKSDVELRIQEYQALLAGLGQTWQKLPADASEGAPSLRAILEELINNELMSQVAVTRGLDRSTDTQRRWEFIRRAFFSQEWLRWNQPRLEPTTEQIQQYYDKNRLGFRRPSRRKVRQITVASEGPVKQALAKLLEGSAQFSDLAKQISLGPTAVNGGLLEAWVMHAGDKALWYGSDQRAEADGVISLDASLEAAVFAINTVNGFSNHVKGPDGNFHIFQLVQEEEARQQRLDEVADGIKTLLMAQGLRESIEELRQGAAIERFPERLDHVEQ